MRATGSVRRAWKNMMKQIAMEEGIPDSYRQVIMFLYHNPGSGQRNIAEFAEVTTSAINQVVKNMLEEGYLRKETDLSDKRNCRLYLTAKGEDVACRLRNRLDYADNAITAYLGEEKEACFIQLLEDLAKFIQEGQIQC